MYIIINNARFNKFVNKYDNIEDVSKIPREFKRKDVLTLSYIDKTLKVNRDSRNANKNKRTTNKDYKDFMNN